MNLKTIGIITIAAGVAIVLVNVTFFTELPQVFAILNMAATFVALGIPLLYKYVEYSKIKQIEILFPRFLTDVTSNIDAGMTLPQSLRTVCSNDYSILNPYVKEMSSKISWGISFEKVLGEFAKKTKSKSLARTIQTIIEAHRSGGTMNTVLAAVSESLQELEKIKKERSSSIYAQMITGYLIYIVFLGVMIGLSTFLIPVFFSQAETSMDFIGLFRSLIIIQGFFAGLSVGKMAEGTILAGAKHSLVLTVLGYSAFLIFV